MLQTLRINNFAIIKEATIDLEGGLTVLTGETGAGKSMVVDAISLLLGARSKAEDIRTGEEEALIEGRFTLPKGKGSIDLFESSGIKIEGDQLIVKRVISKIGKNKILINDSNSTQGFLYNMGKDLVDICAHNENRYLMDPSFHIDLLDDYADLGEKVRAFAQDFEIFRGIEKKKEELVRRKNEALEKSEYLKFIIKEIEELKLKEGEEEELRSLRKKLANLEKIKDLAWASHEGLYSGDGALLEKIKRLSRDFDSLKNLDPSFAYSSETLQGTKDRLSDLAFELKAYIDGLEFDAAALEEVEERLNRISTVTRKHGSVAQALAKAAGAREELNLLENFDSDIAKLAKDEEEIMKKLKVSASEISNVRKRKAKELEKKIDDELKTLGMEKAVFSVKIAKLGSDSKKKDIAEAGGTVLSAKGEDDVSFYISTNVGEELRPLEYVASLGELSRIMLALKGVFYSDSDELETFVFDEIDTGIGGKVAEMVGRKLKQLSTGKQVVCVTHLSQIASWADSHLFIRKSVQQGRTLFSVKKLTGGERKEEIARMLGGVTVTEKTRALAEELLARSAKEANP